MFQKLKYLKFQTNLNAINIKKFPLGLHEADYLTITSVENFLGSELLPSTHPNCIPSDPKFGPARRWGFKTHQSRNVKINRPKNVKKYKINFKKKCCFTPKHTILLLIWSLINLIYLHIYRVIEIEIGLNNINSARAGLEPGTCATPVRCDNH